MPAASQTFPLHWPLVGAAALTGPLAALAPLGLTPLISVAGLALSVPVWRRRHRIGGDLALAIWLVLVVGLCLLSAAWSDHPWQSLTGAVNLGLLLAAGYVVWAAAAMLEPERRKMVLTALVGGTVVAALVLGGFEMAIYWREAPNDFLRQLWLSGHSRGVIVLALLFWPAIHVLSARSRPAAVGLAILVAVVVWFGGTISAVVALALGLLGWSAARLAPRLSSRVGAVAVAAFVLAAPWWASLWPTPQQLADALPFLRGSAMHRAVIWQFTANNIAVRPLTGWGFESSRWIPGADDQAQVFVPAAGTTVRLTQLPLHPHDAPLQWWLELGLPGALLLAAGLALALWRVGGWQPVRRRALGLAVLAALIGVSAISFGAWQKWWLAGIWLMAAWTRLGGDDSPA